MSNYHNQGKYKAQGKRYNAPNAPNSQDYDRESYRGSTNHSSGYSKDESQYKNHQRYPAPKVSENYGGHQQRSYRNDDREDQHYERPRTGYQDKSGQHKSYPDQGRPQTSYPSQQKPPRYNDAQYGKGYQQEERGYGRNPEKNFDANSKKGPHQDYPAKTQ